MKFRKANHTLSHSLAHSWYTKAMNRRRTGSSLAYDSFMCYITSEDVIAFGDCVSGYIYGRIVENVFVPSHFAPKTIRGGVRIIESLAKQSSYPVAAFVPDDLGAMFYKTGKYFTVSLNFPTFFRNEIVIKKVWTNCGIVLDHIHQNAEKYGAIAA